jgi:hypothetical protein
MDPIPATGAFLAEAITPGFPEGLAAWRAEGQWTDSRGQLVRESVLVVEVLRPAGRRAEYAPKTAEFRDGSTTAAWSPREAVGSALPIERERFVILSPRCAPSA